MRISRQMPKEFPFDLANIKLHCRVDDDYTDDDAILKIYALGAARQGEFLTNRIWIDSDFVGSLDTFPNDSIAVPKTPCREVAEITYSDVAGEKQTLPSDAYVFTPSTIIPDGGQPYAAIAPVVDWPDGRNVEISFRGGFAELPEDLFSWLIITISGKYEQRESLASATRKIAIAMPREFHSGLLDAWYLPRY